MAPEVVLMPSSPRSRRLLNLSAESTIKIPTIELTSERVRTTLARFAGEGVSDFQLFATEEEVAHKSHNQYPSDVVLPKAPDLQQHAKLNEFGFRSPEDGKILLVIRVFKKANNGSGVSTTLESVGKSEMTHPICKKQKSPPLLCMWIFFGNPPLKLWSRV
jgi:hypothetical protein